jgi:hypothetical protein
VAVAEADVAPPARRVAWAEEARYAAEYTGEVAGWPEPWRRAWCLARARGLDRAAATEIARMRGAG